MMPVNADEYEPLAGSGPSKKTNMAYASAGAAALLLFGIVAFSGNSAPLTTANAVATTALADADTITGGSFTSGQFQIIYNIFSFVLAAMGAGTVFFFFHVSLVAKPYRTALVITGIVTLIAFYHYIRIFNSWNEAYVLDNGAVTATGVPFNDAYRYVDWLLTVPLLLMELVLVMRLDPAETAYQCAKLGSLAALMVVLGYPGEIADSSSTRWMFWTAAMIPFLCIVYSLFVGLSDSVASQPKAARGLVNQARWITVLSWCTYPVVYIFPMVGFTGASAHTAIQVGYSLADVIAKPGLGLIVWMIAAKKSEEAL